MDIAGGPASENSLAAGLRGESLPPSADAIWGGGGTGPASLPPTIGAGVDAAGAAAPPPPFS